MTTLERIAKILQRELELDDVISADDTFASLGADSLDKVSVVMAVEDEFCIELPGDRANGVLTVGDLVALVDEVAT